MWGTFVLKKKYVLKAIVCIKQVWICFVSPFFILLIRWTDKPYIIYYYTTRLVCFYLSKIYVTVWLVGQEGISFTDDVCIYGRVTGDL